MKMASGAQCGMLNKVKNNPRVSAKDLKKYLAYVNMFADRCTVGKN